MVLTFRADLSHGGPANLPSSRYFSVTRVSVRPGHDTEDPVDRSWIAADPGYWKHKPAPKKMPEQHWS